jgi:hypothetical protein
MRRHLCLSTALLVVALAVNLAWAAPANAGEVLSSGQTVYLPLYSHIYFGDRAREFNLTSTAYVRNTNPHDTITLTRVEYFSQKGKPLKSFIDGPLTIGPFAAKSFTIKESDTTGGSGASIIVQWKSENPVNAPLIESVMIGAASTQGISFVCQGRVIADTSK